MPAPPSPGAPDGGAGVAGSAASVGRTAGAKAAGSTGRSPRRVHFVAIGGTGMGSLAGLLKARGVAVTGSDTALYPPMSTQLARWGIPVHEGFDPEHLRRARPDLVVIGNVVRPDNPEARAALEGGHRVLSFSDALYELAIRGRHSVVITGTHGKTTTTTLLGAVLAACGRDPAVLLGGVTLDFDGPFRDGGGPEFVVEGDEYDTAFFDKTPKFLHYHPRTAVLTSVEFDHADIYRDLGAVVDAFRALVSSLPADGTLVAALDAPHVAEVTAGAPCRVEGYAVDAAAAAASGARWWADAVAPGSEATAFDVIRGGQRIGRARLPLWGRHNVANALAAVAAAAARGVEPARAVAALASFRGVRRRLEERGEAGGVLVVDDFAHHPTAVRETLAAVRARYPERRVLAAFEPRSNTSRRRVFQKAYADALAAADAVVVRAVTAGPLYSAFGETPELLDPEALAADLRSRGRDARALADPEEIAAHVARIARPGDVVLVMSNGDFGGLCDHLLASKRGPEPDRAREDRGRS